MTKNIRDEVRSEILFGEMNLKVYIDKVKKDLKNKNDLNNWLTTVARDRLLSSNPYALSSKTDNINRLSKDPYIKFEAEKKLNSQLVAIQDSRAGVIADMFKGNIKLPHEIDIMWNEFNKYYSLDNQ